MPILDYPILNLDQSVTRPIVTQIVDDIKRLTRLPDNTVIWYPGPDGSTYQPQSTQNPDKNYTNVEGDNNLPRMGTTNQVTIKVTEEYNNDYTLGTATFAPENPFLFIDQDIGVFLKPAYSRTNVLIQIQFRAQSETESEAWRNLLRQRISQNVDVRLYDLIYSYQVSPTCIKIINQMWQLREKVAGYGDTWDDYLRNHFVEKITQVVDEAGKVDNLLWTVPETQIRVPGYWDFDGFPEAGNREEKGGTWTSTVGFRFQYDRPNTQVLFWPLMVHNQLVSKRYRPIPRSWENTHSRAGWSLSSHYLRSFEGNQNRHQGPATEGHHIPWYDEFIPALYIPNTKNVVTALLAIDLDNPSQLCSLKNMGDLIFDPDVLAFMEDEAPYMAQAGKSVFALMLFQGKTMMRDGVLSVDSDLNVSTTIPLNLRKVYHIRLALHYDLTAIDPAAQVRMQRHCKAARKIIAALDYRICLRPGLPVCMDGDIMSQSDFLNMNAILNRKRLGKYVGQGLNPNGLQTVASLFISMRPRANYPAELAEEHRLRRTHALSNSSSGNIYIPCPDDPVCEESTGEST